MWGRGAAIPPVFEDERNVHWHLSFTRGGTRLALSQRTTMSGGRGVGGGRRERHSGPPVMVGSCEVHPVLHFSCSCILCSAHSTSKWSALFIAACQDVGRLKRKQDKNKTLATGTFIRVLISKRWWRSAGSCAQVSARHDLPPFILSVSSRMKWTESSDCLCAGWLHRTSLRFSIRVVTICTIIIKTVIASKISQLSILSQSCANVLKMQKKRAYTPLYN